jgi:hypothetical protein
MTLSHYSAFPNKSGEHTSQPRCLYSYEGKALTELNIDFMKPRVLAAVNVKIAAFWDMTWKMATSVLEECIASIFGVT